MINKVKMNRLYHLALVPLAILLSTSAPAQQAEDQQAEETIEEILVTGSRVRQNPLEARDPVQIFSYEDIKESGEISIGEFLQRLPAHGSAINRTNNASGNLGNPADGGGVGQGSVEMDLRYLAPKRTLILVDGRRWVRNASGSGVGGSVDLHTIPTHAIESVEVLLDGASAIYGSDAIGGVVNIITRSDYDSGLQASAYYGLFEQGDGESLDIDMSFGVSGDRGRALFALSHSDQKVVWADAREISEYAIPYFPWGLSSANAQGVLSFTNELGNRFYGTLNTGVPNTGRSNGGLPDYDPADVYGGDFHRLGFADRYNWMPDNHGLTPNQRTNLFVKSEYDISDQINGRVLIAFTNRQSASQAAPEPLFMGPSAGSSDYLRQMIIPADHEYNPFNVQLGGVSSGGKHFFMGRRPMEVGGRKFEQNVNTWHVSGGLDGSFDVSGNTWYWDVTTSFFQSTATQRKLGGFNGMNLALGMGDAAKCAAVEGCVPINLWGGQTNPMTQEMIDFITYEQNDMSQQEMLDFSANISGQLFELPAGTVGVAAGMEWREENGFFRPDSFVTAKQTAVGPRHRSQGGFDVLEYYGEIVVPVVDRLDINGAVRVSNFNLYESHSVFKVGARFMPVDTLAIRASFSEGYRAPNIGELYNVPFETPLAINDPCSGSIGGVILANCQALGVPPGFESMNTQPPVLTGGSMDLRPEESENFTAGFTWDALSFFAAEGSLLERFVTEVNYYDIDVSHAVQSPIVADIVNQCVNTADPFFCAPIKRGSDGEIMQIDAVLRNFAGVQTRGLDVSLSVETQDFSFGKFSFDWTANFMFEYTERDYGPTAELITTSREGWEIGEAGRGFPELKSSFTARWEREILSVGVTSTFIQAMTEPCAGLTSSYAWDARVLALCSGAKPFVYGGDLGTNAIDSRLYFDVFASLRPRDWMDSAIEITVGVQNILDEDPPVCRSCRMLGWDGTLYRFPGIFTYARVTYRPEE